MGGASDQRGLSHLAFALDSWLSWQIHYIMALKPFVLGFRPFFSVLGRSRQEPKANVQGPKDLRSMAIRSLRVPVPGIYPES